MNPVPTSRIRVLRDPPLRLGGSYVLYWMIASRRLHANFALQRAAELAAESGLPLLVLEPLRVAYPHASDRFHRFVLDGMADNERTARRAGVAYHPYVEPAEGAGSGLLAALSEDAAAVVTDDAPWFIFPAMLAAAARRVKTRFEAVDGDGLLPMREADRAFRRAHDFRRFLHKTLPTSLRARPHRAPLERIATLGQATIRASVVERWPAASTALLRGDGSALRALPIDHTVPAVATTGGHTTAMERLGEFVRTGLESYAVGRNHPDRDTSSHLSPWLHFGHLGADEVFEAVTARAGWSPDRLSGKADGRREGWWGMAEGPEAFVDQLITWRELGRNLCVHRTDYDAYDSLPDWAQTTLHEHAADPRPETYTLDQLDRSQTADEIWNAAQRQLRREGRIHNYLRMLWGKRILEWSPTPREAAARMVHLNDRYALDGRDPNSTSGIFWVLGRYDRAWGPERPIFGKIRYMSSANTRRKVRMSAYLARFGPFTEER